MCATRANDDSKVPHSMLHNIIAQHQIVYRSVVSDFLALAFSPCLLLHKLPVGLAACSQACVPATQYARQTKPRPGHFQCKWLKGCCGSGLSLALMPGLSQPCSPLCSSLRQPTPTGRDLMREYEKTLNRLALSPLHLSARAHTLTTVRVKPCMA